jgi:hypothetical protein
MFAASVEYSSKIAGRGIDIIGHIIQGKLPPMGTEVTVHFEGRPPVTAVLQGFAMSVPPPKVGLLLGRVTLDQVPVGAQITSD